MLELDNNEAITSMALAAFSGSSGAEGGAGGSEAEPLLAVGTAEGLAYFPTDCQQGFIRLYRWGWVVSCTVFGAGL